MLSKNVRLGYVANISGVLNRALLQKLPQGSPQKALLLEMNSGIADTILVCKTNFKDFVQSYHKVPILNHEIRFSTGYLRKLTHTFLSIKTQVEPIRENKKHKFQRSLTKVLRKFSNCCFLGPKQISLKPSELISDVL